VDDGAEPEREIGEDVYAGQHFQNGQEATGASA